MITLGYARESVSVAPSVQGRERDALMDALLPSLPYPRF